VNHILSDESETSRRTIDRLWGVLATFQDRSWHFSEVLAHRDYFRFSNRPFGVKRFQTIHHYSVDVARRLALLFGIGAKALPSWDSKTRWNNLSGGLAVR
jgi:hypothetical protein